jgi:hypothetical protein
VRNGPGSEIRDNPSSLFVKNRADSPLLMRADILSDLTNVSERLAQRIQFIFNNIFLCRMASDDCYGDYLSPDSRDILLWWICSTVREADILSELTDVSERLAQTNSVYIITLFLCRMLSDVCYEDCMTVDEDYCGEYVSLFATIRC